MGGISAQAPTSQLALASATGVLSKSMALLGGPIGVAFTALSVGLVAVGMRTSDLENLQARLNEIQMKSLDISSKLTTASGERKKSLEQERDALIEQSRAEVESARVALSSAMARLDAEQSKSALRPSRITGTLIAEGNLKDRISELQAARKALENVESSFAIGGGGSVVSSPSGSKSNGDKKNEFGKVLSNLRKESEQLKIQKDLYGEKEEKIDAIIQKSEIEFQLAEKGITLTKDQSKEIDKYLSQIQEQKEALEGLSDTSDDLKDAYKDLGMSFSSSLEDAIVEGKKFSDVLSSLAEDIQRILVRKTITEPLANGISSFASNLGASIFGGSKGSFATGIANVPYDMTARVHKGEAIIPAQQARNMGGGVNVSIVNNNSSQIDVQQNKNASGGMDLKLMIDQAVSKGVSNTRSPINRSINQSFTANPLLVGR
jgi:hypothetical protein